MVARDAGLGLFFALSKSFGETYGPLAGIVALLLWALLSAVALLFGGAVAAQLEAVRAGVREPQDAEKVEHSEPEASRRRARALSRDRRVTSRGPSTSSDRRCDGPTGVPADVEGVIGVPATEGNRIDVLRNGDEIFPAMLEAIEQREQHRSTS